MSRKYCVLLPNKVEFKASQPFSFYINGTSIELNGYLYRHGDSTGVPVKEFSFRVTKAVAFWVEEVS